MSARIAGLCLLLPALFAAPAARAHRIDGSWCSPDGRSLQIDGRSIRTPGGRQMEGSYSRYSFDYVGPEGETDAGAGVKLRLLTDEELSVTEPSRGGARVWHRCRLTS